MLPASVPTLTAVSSIVAYLIGGLPFGYWFVRLTLGKDIRTMGSGNIGATNVHRSAGGKAGLVVLLLDIFKGFAAVWITAVLTSSNDLALALAAALVMLGHCYPVFLRFRGGKAVACFVGAFLCIAPLAVAIVIVFFIAVVFFTGYVSLGSILGAVVFPPLVWATIHPSPPIVAASVFASLLIIYRHKGNISRLKSGTEPPFSLRGKKA